MKTPNAFCAAAILLFAAVGASGAEPDSKSCSFCINPTIIDSKNNTGGTVGIDYNFKGDLLSKDFASKDTGSSIDPDATLGSAVVSYFGSGTVAASKERNPKNFLDFLLDAKLKYSAPRLGTVLGGLFTKYETDQSFDNRQAVYGLRATYGKFEALGKNDFVALDLSYGRVDPKEDAVRQAALGTDPLEPYYRWNLEFLYMYPLRWKVVTAVELNYRLFLENSAPASIKAADLDKHELATIRIGLQNDLFLAYSAGKLPFDRRNDNIFQIGFSYKLF
jgi:hypothetical protein